MKRSASVSNGLDWTVEHTPVLDDLCSSGVYHDPNDMPVSPGPLFGFNRFPSPRFSRSNSLNASFEGLMPMHCDDVHSMACALPPEPAVFVKQELVKQESFAKEESHVKLEQDATVVPPVSAEVTNAMVTFNVGRKVDIKQVIANVPEAFRNKEKAKDISAYISNRNMEDDVENSNNRKARRSTKTGAKKATAKKASFADKTAYKAQIWPSGKIVVYAKTVDSAMLSANEVVQKLRIVDASVAMHDLKVINVVGEVSCPFGINLDALARQHPDCTSYNPHARSPEVKYRLQGGVKLRIFPTGRISIQAATSMQAVHAAFASIYPVVRAVATSNV